MNDIEALRLDLKNIGALGNPNDLTPEVHGWESFNPNYDSVLPPVELILELATSLSLPELAGQFSGVEGVVEVLAWYVPFHYSADHAGVYVTARGIEQYATAFARNLASARKAIAISPDEWAWCIILAMETLVAHEVFHHQFEVALTRLELATSTSLYAATRVAGPTSELRLLEEAVATSRMVRPRPRLSSLSAPADLRRAQRNAMKKLIPGFDPGYCDGLRYVNREQFVGAQVQLVHLTHGARRRLAPPSQLHVVSLYGEIRELLNTVHIRYDSSPFSRELRSILSAFKPVSRSKIEKFFESLPGVRVSRKHHQLIYRAPGMRRAFPLPDHGKDVEGPELNSLAKLLQVSIRDLSRALDGDLDGSHPLVLSPD